MKKKTHNDRGEKLKQNIKTASEQSKETIRGIIAASLQQFENALETNKKFMESLDKHILNKNFVDGSVFSEVKKTFSNSVELSEESIDAIIDIQSMQLQSAIDLNMKLVEEINNLDFSDKEDIDTLHGVIEKNFEESTRQSIENAKKMAELYNKHINLTFNFNERFSKNINSQLQTLNRFQNRNMEMFNDWATHWWKSSSREEMAV